MDAYSEDLRKKIVQALRERRMNKSEAARAFSVSLSSVKRYAKAAGVQSHRGGLLQAKELSQRDMRSWPTDADRGHR
jgi:transposase